MRSSILAFTCGCAIAIATVSLAATSWPQFRGPGGSGIAEGPNLPERWSATENVAWKVPIAGTGWSSPIVAGDRVFLTSVVSASETEKPALGVAARRRAGVPDWIGGRGPISKLICLVCRPLAARLEVPGRLSDGGEQQRLV